MHVLGIDCGLSYTTNSSGVCQIIDQQTEVFRTFSDKLSKLEVLNLERNIDIICVDAPLLPNTYRNKRVDGNVIRVVEKLFTSGNIFPSRCKPGHTNSKKIYDGRSKINGNTGYGLRRAGSETIVQFIEYLETNKNKLLQTNFPQVEYGHNFIETCPNVVLGILLDNSDYNQLPQKKKGHRDTFDRLYDYCQKNRLFEKLRLSSNFSKHSIWTNLSQETDHEKRAALICSLIGMLVYYGSYIAIGDDDTGYFFLPSADSWGDWVKKTLQTNLNRIFEDNDSVSVILWSNGIRYNLECGNYTLPN